MPKIFKSKFFTILLISALVLPCLLAMPVVADETYPYDAEEDDEVADALKYLREQLSTEGEIGDFATSAWAVMAISAAGEDPDDWKDDPANPSIVDYLEANADSAASSTDYARMLLAIAAADEEPMNFGGRDFIYLLESTYDGNQIGSDELLNDDFWGVMALIAAGEDPEESTIIQDSVYFILDNQNEDDGGWSWGVGQASDVDDTASAIMALIAAGEDPESDPIANGLEYIKDMQMENGGFESWEETNSATDSWGIDAIVAAGEDPTSTDDWEREGNNPVDDLLSFQNTDGSFDWTEAIPSNQALMTSYAIPALVGVPYPVATLPPQEGVSVNVRVEGENDTIWSGRVIVTESTITDEDWIEHELEQPTVMGALDEASQLGGFSYVVQDTAYGLYVYSVDDEEAEGLAGWLFLVDYVNPGIGAADFILDETTPPDPPHQEVLWYYGEWGVRPLKVEVDNTSPAVDETFTVTVTEYDEENDEWLPTEGATVHAYLDYTTDDDGEVEITIDRNLTVKVYAEKEGYIRSNRVTVTVGEGSVQPEESEKVSLTADIIPAMSFSVSPNSINFGELGPRDTSDPVEFELTNDGTWELLVTAKVTDDAENLYVNGLELDNEKWDEFKTEIKRDKSKYYEATLTVPETYTLTGSQSGTLIFWASEAP